VKPSNPRIPLNIQLCKEHIDYLNDLSKERKQSVSQVLKTIIDSAINLELTKLLQRAE